MGATESALTIRRRLDEAARELDVQELADDIARGLLHGTMLGALDSVWEREENEPVPLEPFAGWRADLLHQRGTGKPFSQLTYDEALRQFQQRQVLTPDAFDALQAGQKRQAFAIAGLAQTELLEEAHDALERMLRDSPSPHGGPNLRDFQDFARDHLESAGWTPANPSHVETVYRTNIVSAYSTGRFVEMRQPAVMKARPYWQIFSVRDSRSRPAHAAAHGTVLPADDPFWQVAYPPFGYNCFLPSQEVSGRFVGASRAFYQGQAVELRTAEGRRLSVTANHPVLTTRGFVRAGELEHGDQLVCHRAETGVGLLRASSQRDEDHRPAVAEQVFGALAQAFPGQLARPAPDDFHGEACRFVGEVDVVGSYGALAVHADSSFAHQSLDIGLEPPNAAAAMCSDLQVRGLAATTTTDGVPGSAALPLDAGPVGLEGLPLERFSFGLAAGFDAVAPQHAVEDVAAATEFAAQLLQGRSSEVVADELVFVRKFEWVGHVYDFETSSGLVVAGGVVTSNCRCRVVSRSQRWVDTNGATVGARPAGLPDPGFDSGTTALPGATEAVEETQAQQPAQAAPPAPPRPPGPVVGPAPPERPATPRPSPPVPPAAGGQAPPQPPIPPAPPTGDEDPRRFTEEHYEAAGVEIQGPPQRLWRVMDQVLGTRDPQVARRVLGIDGVAPGAKVQVTTYYDRLSISAEHEGIWVDRSISRENGKLVVTNELFSVDSNGQGTGRKVLAGQLAEYRRLGVDRVDLTAVDVGQYVWPRMGYALRNPAEMADIRRRYKSWLRDFTNLPESLADAPADLHEIALQTVGEQKVGKEFLLWNGRNNPGVRLQLDINGEAGKIADEYVSQLDKFRMTSQPKPKLVDVAETLVDYEPPVRRALVCDEHGNVLSRPPRLSPPSPEPAADDDEAGS